MPSFVLSVLFLVGHHQCSYDVRIYLINMLTVYFIYPETANVRLEDMDQLFGDATTAMPTPAQHAEVESLMARSPVPSLDIRTRPGHFSADNAIPGLDINPPDGDAENGKAQRSAETEMDGQGKGVTGWISRMVNKNKSNKGANGEAGAYRRLDQDDE